MTRVTRMSWAVLGPVVLLTSVLPASAATQWPLCRDHMSIAVLRLDGSAPPCHAPEKNVARLVTSFDCDRGAVGGCSYTNAEWMAFGGYPVGNPPCESSVPGPVIASTCMEEELPKQCKEPDTNAPTSSAGYLGDPVDLTSGA